MPSIDETVSHDVSQAACATCRSYRSGECHAAPPVRLPRKFNAMATAGNRVRDEGVTWGWPTVRPTDWCGYHCMAPLSNSEQT